MIVVSPFLQTFLIGSYYLHKFGSCQDDYGNTERYQVFSVTALSHKVSLKVCLCHSVLLARNLRKAQSDRRKGEVKASPFPPWQGVLIFSKLCYCHQAVARSASVAGTASTTTLGAPSKESTSSEGLTCGGRRFSEAAPSDWRWAV
jgi:hypothetical protein